MPKRKRKSIKARNGSKTMAEATIFTVKKNGKVGRPKKRKR
jgi:hypothetical protein